MSLPTNLKSSFRLKSIILPIFAVDDQVPQVIARHVFAARHSQSCFLSSDRKNHAA
jgi:hypothetical protein